MVTLSSIHIIYLIGVIIILSVMVLGKDILIPCIIFIFLIGFLLGNSIFSGVNLLFNSIVFSGQKFMDIIVTISIISALSKLLSDLNSDYLMMKPTIKFMKTPAITFWILGFIMYGFSLFLWPSPSVALVGAIMLPIVYKKGLNPLIAAVAINIFGHGAALSHDFIIQGAPSVTASTAGITSSDILNEGRILFLTMSIVTTIASFIVIRGDIKDNFDISQTEAKRPENIKKSGKIIAVLTFGFFFIDILALRIFGIVGGDATALIVSTAILILLIGTVLEYKEKALDRITEYVREGFLFGIKIFAPVIIIGAYFFLGGQDITGIAGENSYTEVGFMTDFATWLSMNAPINKIASILLQIVIGGLTGLDGSGFSGLPLVGTMAATFGNALDISVPVLASVGQISAVWIGGGVLVPWSLVAVAGVCNIEPIDLAKKNLVPVCIGLTTTFIMACIIL